MKTRATGISSPGRVDGAVDPAPSKTPQEQAAVAPDVTPELKRRVAYSTEGPVPNPSDKDGAKTVSVLALRAGSGSKHLDDQPAIFSEKKALTFIRELYGEVPANFKKALENKNWKDSFLEALTAFAATPVQIQEVIAKDLATVRAFEFTSIPTLLDACNGLTHLSGDELDAFRTIAARLGDLGPGVFSLARCIQEIPQKELPKLATLMEQTKEYDCLAFHYASVEFRAQHWGGQNAELQHAYDTLLATPGFRTLEGTIRESVLSIVRGYADKETIVDICKLMEIGWFQKPKAYESRDQEVLARTVACLSYASHASRSKAQRVVLGWTLDKLLAAETGLSVQLDDLSGRTFGFNSGKICSINRSMAKGAEFWEWARMGKANLEKLSATNQSAFEDSQHVALHTVAHELCHATAHDHVAATFEYFMGEYRGWYVGFVGQFGRKPNREEAYARARYLLSPGDSSAAYSYIQKARVSVEDRKLFGLFKREVPGEESKKIIRFMNQFAASPVNVNERESGRAIINFGRDGNLADPTSDAPMPNPPLEPLDQLV